MTDQDWKLFLQTARRVLGKGDSHSSESESWCAWTTFSSLSSDIHYWCAGLPDESELLDSGTADGGTWGQPFPYSDIAHVIIPSTFYWERYDGREFNSGTKTQDINRLSAKLSPLGIVHRKTGLILEIKLY